MKKAVAVVIMFANLTWAQGPATEQEWRSEIQKVQREHREASSNMWGGVGLGVAGAALVNKVVFYSGTHRISSKRD